MPLTLPDFRDARYAGVRACGELVIPDGGLDGHPAMGKKGFVTLYESAMGSAWAYFRMGKDEPHFHLEAMLASVFAAPDRDRVDKSKLEEMASAVIDYEVRDIDVTTWYQYAMSDLNPSGPIRTLNIGAQTNELTMKITSATMELSGAVDLEVYWRLHPSKEKVLIALTATVDKFVVDESYLQTIAREVDPYIDSIVTGRVTDDVA